MSTLSAYLQSTSAPGQSQSQHQSQLPHMPQLPEQHSVDSWQGQQPVGVSARQQLAHRSLSEAAADRRSSDMLRAHLAAQSLASASGSLPSDALPQGPASLHTPAVTAGTTLAQQSLLYAPTQLGQQQAMSNPSLQPMFSPYSPHGFSSNPFGSQSNSFDLPRSSFSDPRLSDARRRSSVSQPDWMSTGTRYSGDRFSGDRFSGDRFGHDNDMFKPGSDMLRAGSGLGVGSSRRSSFGNAIMGSSFDHDWAARSVGRMDPNNFAVRGFVFVLHHCTTCSVQVI